MSNYEIGGFLQCSENILQQPDLIEPLELAQYFQSFAAFGLHDHITSLVQRYFYANLNSNEIIRYVRLLDKLIQISYPLPRTFPAMFIECFRICHLRGQRSFIEELKILRKMWTPIFNKDNTIHYLRQEVYNLTKVDLDHDLRQESKRFLRNYFLNSIRLPAWQIESILQPNTPLRKILKPTNASHNQNLNLANVTLGQKKVKIDRDSAQTVDQSMPEPKMVQKATTEEKVRQMLRMMKGMSDLKCKECGKRFSSQKSYQKHRQGHFHQKMKAFNLRQMSEGMRKLKIGNMKSRREKNVKQFMGEETEMNLDSTFIAVKQITKDDFGTWAGHSLSCKFCGAEFPIVFKDEIFFQNILRVRFDDHSPTHPNSDEGFHYLHAHCYQALNQS